MNQTLSIREPGAFALTSGDIRVNTPKIYLPVRLQRWLSSQARNLGEEIDTYNHCYRAWMKEIVSGEGCQSNVSILYAQRPRRFKTYEFEN